MSGMIKMSDSCCVPVEEIKQAVWLPFGCAKPLQGNAALALTAPWGNSKLLQGRIREPNTPAILSRRRLLGSAPS
jgi:hypothetical protein